MKTKVKIFLLIISISAIFCTNTFAVSKTDIIDYVNAQTVCGDTGLFNSYKTTFTRLLKQKRLSESEVNTIYSYLQNSVGILNSKGVCKIADLSKLTSSEKSTVYNSLKAGAGIITQAPLLQYGEEDKTLGGNSSTDSTEETKNDTVNQEQENITSSEEGEGTKVTINTQDNTMDIYENGVLIDKVSMSGNKMTYTGVNTTHVIIVVGCIAIFAFALVLFIKLYKKHTGNTRFIKNILVSLMICTCLIGLIIGLFSSKIDSLMAMVELISIKSNNSEIKVELNEDKSIKKYPSYGSNYATLKIPSLDIENKVYFGDITSILALGIGHSTWSDMPTEDGTIVYSGHNRDTMLNNLKDIKKGDEIVVDTSYATCTYKVNNTEILKDTQTDKLTKIGSTETLILYTCYPFDTYVYTDERFVVYSVLKEIEWK